jgi:hypothetical protein
VRFTNGKRRRFVEGNKEILRRVELIDAQSQIRPEWLGGDCGGYSFVSLGNGVIYGHNLLVLRQYGLLDHVARFSIDRKCNILLTALAVRPVRK